MSTVDSENAPMDMTMKLFVGQVPKSMEEDDLKPFFEKYGTLSSVKILRDRDTKNHKGCAFVTFENLDDADNAIHEMHDRVALAGAKKEMQIKPVHNEDEKKFEKRLFVGMISKSITAAELEEMFSKFGEITDCNILFGPDKSSKGCGFVKFEKGSSCLNAIKEMHHNQTLEGCNAPMVVKHADSPADKMKRQAQSAGPGYDDRQIKRPFLQSNYPQSHSSAPQIVSQPQMHPYQQPQQHTQQTSTQQKSTAMALINAFTPLLASVAEQNNPGTTEMLIKSIKIALTALQHENTPSAHTALVTIASNLSVAVANNISRNQNQNSYNQGYNSPAADNSSQYGTQEYSGSVQQYNYSNQSSGYFNGQNATSPANNSQHYNFSSTRPN